MKATFLFDDLTEKSCIFVHICYFISISDYKRFIVLRLGAKQRDRV